MSGYNLTIVWMIATPFTLIIGTIVTLVWMTKRAQARSSQVPSTDS